MQPSFYFYDLETSGISPAKSRIMQFAGQRTDLALKAIEPPLNTLIKLTPDILPDPFAVIVHKITPQKTLADGLSEADFLKQFERVAARGKTIFVGFNNIRFDDEFMRYTNYRNYYDPYEWHYKDNNSRWDLLDMVRMTRALRPEGIIWPLTKDGAPTNRLELLSAANNLDHFNAHDAMADVKATIEIARLIKNKQPKLFNFLLSLRSKHKVAEIVEQKDPFIYTSGHFSSKVLHTTIVKTILPRSDSSSALVYDLRQDPKLFINLSVEELIGIWRYSEDPEALRLPIKTLKYNRVPAIAPLNVLDAPSRKRLAINIDLINQHLETLNKHQAKFATKLQKAVEIMDDQRQASKQTALIEDDASVDEQLYDGFIDKNDTPAMAKIRNLKDVSETANIKFKDQRLNKMLPLYIARNFPEALSAEQQKDWKNYYFNKLGGSLKNRSQIIDYFNKIEMLKKNRRSKADQFILEELRLYGQSVLQSFEPDFAST